MNRKHKHISDSDFDAILLELKTRQNLSAIDANVELVRAERVRLIGAPVPKSVRAALNQAVKNGRLGHLKKDGHKPEAYFHPNFDYLAKEDRNLHAQAVLRAVAACCA